MFTSTHSDFAGSYHSKSLLNPFSRTGWEMLAEWCAAGQPIVDHMPKRLTPNSG